ncbi:MAG: hypothetical protein M3Q05_09990, partial [Bacteroidota bacterium]|nr:hypothetical protein [Bacteroidota bacterium]
MKRFPILIVLGFILVNCQPKKSEDTTTTASPPISTDSVKPEVIPPDRTVTRLDSSGDAASSPA